jgi:uncharacterized membrane protein
MGLIGTSLASQAFLRNEQSLPLRAGAGALGLLILSRSLTNLETRRLLGIGGGQALTLHKTMEIAAPLEEVYLFWNQFENFPAFMKSVHEVRTHGDRKRSHWTLRGPAGTRLHFDAERTLHIPNQVLAWKTVPGSALRHSGQIKFFPGSHGGTKIELELSYSPPAGIVGLEFAKLLGIEPKKRVEESLYQMKQIIEQGPSPRQARSRIS